MISLRQHIFSLVAVFVALAVGIAAGSTVVRGPLLDSTRARLESAEELIEQERAENDTLGAELSQLDDWQIDGPNQLVSGRLGGSAVLLIVAGDVDNDVVRGVIRALRASDAEYVGEVRLDPLVFDVGQVDRVNAVVGVSSAEPTDVQIAFGVQVGDLVAEVSDSILDRSTADSGSVLHDAFGEFEDAGLVDLLGASRDEIVVEDFQLVVLTDRNLITDPALVLDGIVAISDPGGRSVNVMAAEVGRLVQGNDAPVPSFVGAIRDNGRLRDEISTVDNAETILGWVAIVLGLEAGRSGQIEHYGFRKGAGRAIPQRSP